MRGLRLVVWFILLATVTAEAQSPSYRILRVHKKKAEAEWPRVAEQDREYIRRQETASGNWALEADATPEEGYFFGQILNAKGSIFWEGLIGNKSLLSAASPAVLSYSNLGRGVYVYNPQLGSGPIYSDTGMDVMGAVQSPDGSAFAVVGSSEIRVISNQGDLLARVPIDDSLHIVSIALADDAAYLAAYARSKSGLSIFRERSPVDIAESTVTADSEGRHQASDTRRHGEPSPRPLDFGDPLILVFDRDGNLADRILPKGKWSNPQALALSPHDPPLIALGCNAGVALWNTDGELVWADSASFSASNRTTVLALHVSADRRTHALTYKADDPAARFWAWDSSGALEASLALPEEFDASRGGTFLYEIGPRSIGIQSLRHTLTIGRANWRR